MTSLRVLAGRSKWVCASLLWGGVILGGFPSTSSGGETVPACKYSDVGSEPAKVLPVDNLQVLQLKKSSKNQYHDRGHIQGKLEKIYPDQNDHCHFTVRIGDGPSDIIEVVYNDEFGKLPSLKTGMDIEACGDYITSNAPAGGYPVSPAGAIIHWVHLNPNESPGAHPSGFVRVGGDVYGQTVTGAALTPSDGPY